LNTRPLVGNSSHSTSRRFLGFSSTNPSLDLATTGIFGLLQIVGICTFYREMINSYYSLQ
jgi:hypothetical protein